MIMPMASTRPSPLAFGAVAVPPPAPPPTPLRPLGLLWPRRQDLATATPDASVGVRARGTEHANRVAAAGRHRSRCIAVDQPPVGPPPPPRDQRNLRLTACSR